MLAFGALVRRVTLEHDGDVTTRRSSRFVPLTVTSAGVLYAVAFTAVLVTVGAGAGGGGGGGGVGEPPPPPQAASAAIEAVMTASDASRSERGR